MGKYHYFYKINTESKKNKKKGILPITKFIYNVGYSEKERSELIRANFIEVAYYRLFSSPFKSLSSWWSKLNTNQKINIVGIIVLAIINIAGWFVANNNI